MGRIVIVGGGGLRTPLLVHGLCRAREALGIDEILLHDVEQDHARQMTELGRAVVQELGGGVDLQPAPSLETALRGARCVVISIRVGGMTARARDEQAVLAAGAVGQETTGAGGMAMALRTLPVILEQARLIARVAPKAWVINFTNPAGLITQALCQETPLRVVGICDTPGELFHSIARALELPPEQIRCDYLGLNHLGWVQRVIYRGEDQLPRLLADPEHLRRVHERPLFEPQLIQALRLIPSEYLFFYYSRSRALANQRATGTTRGQVLERDNEALRRDLSRLLDARDHRGALERYRAYLRARSASYLRLEAGDAPAAPPVEAADPFEAATGYHCIAIDVMRALFGAGPARIVVNTPSRGAIAELAGEDVVEVPCQVSSTGVQPLACGRLPTAVRGLVLAVKAYERLTIRAAITRSNELARLALVTHPLVGDHEHAGRLLQALAASDPRWLPYLGG